MATQYQGFNEFFQPWFFPLSNRCIPEAWAPGVCKINVWGYTEILPFYDELKYLLIGGTFTTPLSCSRQCHDPGDHDHATDVHNCRETGARAKNSAIATGINESSPPCWLLNFREISASFTVMSRK